MAETVSIYQDIASRTGGDVYIGVVGPVRTGKSTFIKRFMEALVLPNITDAGEKARALDELPQSASGRTVMTAEPKFIPAEAVALQFAGEEEDSTVDMRVRMVDCVGFAVDGARGFEDEDGPRMVDTPWSDEPMSFEMAASIGTEKVIVEHSTIGVVVLADGSFGEISRSSYLPAEQRVIDQLRDLGKPFVVVLNSTHPEADETLDLADELAASTGVTVLPLDVSKLDYDDITDVLNAALYEFPVTAINVSLPLWVQELEPSHWLRQSYEGHINLAASSVSRVRDISAMLDQLRENEYASDVRLAALELGSGEAAVSLMPQDGLFWQVLGEYAGEDVSNEASLVSLVRRCTAGAREWDKIRYGMEEAADCGYGVVEPRLEEMFLEEPELIRTGGHFGVKLKASAPSYHIIRTSIGTEVTPLVGTEKQCADLVRYIMDEFEDDPAKIWQTNIFGKSLHELVSEGISGKLNRMPEKAQEKLALTLQRIVNETGGGIICIIL